MDPLYTSQQYLGDEDKVDIKRYLSLFISNWYWVAISLLIALSISYGINRWSEEVYTVSSTILIKDDANAGLTNIFPGSSAYKGQQNLNNEMGILRSYKLNYRVMKELPEFNTNYIKVGKRGVAETRLYKTSPFVVIYDSLEKQTMGLKVEIRIKSEERYVISIDGGNNSETEKSFGDQFKGRGFDFRIELRDKEGFRFDPENSNRYYFYFVSIPSLANQYRSKLLIAPAYEESSLMTLTTSGFVPEQEAEYLNKLMDVYLNFGMENKNLTVEQTIAFIDQQLTKVSDSLRRAEGNIERFKISNKMIEISSEAEFLQGKLEKIDMERADLLMKRRYLDYLKDYIGGKIKTEGIIAPALLGITDEQLIRLVNQLTEKEQEKRRLLMNLDSGTVTLKLISSEVVMIHKALEENIEDGFINIKEAFEETDKKTKLLDDAMMKLPASERQLINIQRNYDISNTVYTYLLEKKAEAGIARASNVADNQIIDFAGPATSYRIKPKEMQNRLMAIIIGLVLPLLGIILIDLLNDKIIDKKDIEKVTNAPILGYISHNTLNSELPVVEKTGSTLAESFRSVRTNLKYFIKDTQSPVISVSSTITAEGKTFISANLAAIIALSGKRVLLVGLDLRKPRIHKLFGISNATGISNYLIGQEKFEDVIIKTDVNNLWYATAGPVPPNPAELIDSPEMVEFIEKAKKEFDYVIIDTPPVAIVTDALLCSAFTDFYIFVVRQRYSSKSTLSLIEELHKSKKLKNIGLVINDINLSGYYGYGLRYGYSLGYGYTYGYNYYGSYSDRKYGYKDSSNRYYTED